MASLVQRLELLRHAPASVVEKLLLDTLAHARPEEFSPICLRLVQTARPAAIEAVINRLDRADDRVRTALEDPGLPFAEAARLILGRKASDATEAVIALAVRRGEIRLIAPIAARLADPDIALAREAGEAVLRLVEIFASRSCRGPLARDTMRIVDEVLARSVAQYPRHRQRPVLLAAAILARRPGPRLQELFDDHAHPAHYALRSVTEDLRRPLVREHLLRWCDHPLFGSGVIRRLHRLEKDAFGEFLAAGHLLLCAAKRRALRHADRPQRCLPSLEAARRLPADAQRWIVPLVSALRPTEGSSDRYLADLIALPAPRARLAVLQRLQASRREQADTIISRLVADEEPAIARLAARHLSRASRTASAGVLLRLESSPHRSIARQAQRRRVRNDVGAFFDQWMTLSAADRHLAARRLLHHRRDSFLAAMRDELQSGQRQRTMEGIQLVRRLVLGAAFEATLMGHTFNPDARIASVAVMALGETGSSHVLEAVRAALNHIDPRVQASAVEALDRLKAPEAGDLVSFLMNSRENRPRANAVWALLRRRPEEAKDQLRSMLHDTNPLHRVSGLWLARRLRDRDVQADVTRIASDDALVEVRRRAALTARCLA